MCAMYCLMVKVRQRDNSRAHILIIENFFYVSTVRTFAKIYQITKYENFRVPNKIKINFNFVYHIKFA